MRGAMFSGISNLPFEVEITPFYYFTKIPNEVQGNREQVRGKK